MTIGENIRRFRNAAHETQEQLAKALGDYTSNAVSQWENDRAVPRMGAIEAMASHWHVSKAQIVDETTVTLITVNTPEERTLLLSYRDLDATGRQKLIEYANDLLSSGRYARGEGEGDSLLTA